MSEVRFQPRKTPVDSGQRTRKTVYQGDGISIDSITIYHYDQQGYLITEITETGALIKDYIWQQGLHPVAQIDASMPAQETVQKTNIRRSCASRNPVKQPNPQGFSTCNAI